MEDDHVDRPGVEVRQRMKLTGTNSSIGLIVLIDYAHRTSFDVPDLCPGAVAALPLRSGRAAPQGATATWPCGALLRRPQEGSKTCSKKENRLTPASFSKHIVALCRPGGYGGVAAPVPFPNTAVKRPCAHGTSS